MLYEDKESAIKADSSLTVLTAALLSGSNKHLLAALRIVQRKLDCVAQYREDTKDDGPWLALLLVLCDPRQQAQFDHGAAAGLVHISVTASTTG